MKQEPNMNVEVDRRFRVIAPMRPKSATSHRRPDGTWMIGVVYESGIGNRYQVTVNELIPFVGTLFKMLAHLDDLELQSHKELRLGLDARGVVVGQGKEVAERRNNNKASPKAARQMG